MKEYSDILKLCLRWIKAYFLMDIMINKVLVIVNPNS